MEGHGVGCARRRPLPTGAALLVHFLLIVSQWRQSQGCTCTPFPTSPRPHLLAGALAGPALLMTGSQDSHASLALYVLIRGVTLLVRCGNLPDAHPLKVAAGCMHCLRLLGSAGIHLG